MKGFEGRGRGSRYFEGVFERAFESDVGKVARPNKDVPSSGYQLHLCICRNHPSVKPGRQRVGPLTLVLKTSDIRPQVFPNSLTQTPVGGTEVCTGSSAPAFAQVLTSFRKAALR